jgi:hypothetical protein
LIRPVTILVFMLASILASRGLDGPSERSFHFEKGFIVKPNGDTIQGFIYRRSENSISKGIRFTTDSLLDADARDFSPADLRMFFLAKDGLTFEPVDYSYTKDKVEITERRFAKKLFAGYAVLYKLQVPPDEQNLVFEKNYDFVYVIRINNEDNVLRQIEKAEGTDYVCIKKYIGTLKFLFKDCPSVVSSLNDLRFCDESMISVVKRYCGCIRPDEPQITVAYKVKFRIHHSAEITYCPVLNKQLTQILTAGYMAEFVYPDLSDNLSINIGLEPVYIRESSGEKSMYGFDIPIVARYEFNIETISPFVIIGQIERFVPGAPPLPLAESLFDAGFGFKIHKIKIMGTVQAVSLIGADRIYSTGLAYEF